MLFYLTTFFRLFAIHSAECLFVSEKLVDLHFFVLWLSLWHLGIKELLYTELLRFSQTNVVLVLFWILVTLGDV